MENLFNPAFHKLYMKGYVFGLNPVFLDFEDVTNIAPRFNNKAFKSGFYTGRKDYERLNGPLADGTPKHVLTDKVLENFRIDGQIGLPLEASGYTAHQLNYISRYYNNGARQYESNNDISLHILLSTSGIDL